MTIVAVLSWLKLTEHISFAESTMHHS